MYSILFSPTKATTTKISLLEQSSSEIKKQVIIIGGFYFA